jgi:hypothetical protein
MPIAVLLLFLVRSAAAPQLESFRFVILGDRTGDARPGVYEQVWQEAAAEDPAFVVTAGDTIEGLNDGTAQAEWQALERILEPYRRAVQTASATRTATPTITATPTTGFCQKIN